MALTAFELQSVLNRAEQGDLRAMGQVLRELVAGRFQSGITVVGTADITEALTGAFAVNAVDALGNGTLAQAAPLTAKSLNVVGAADGTKAVSLPTAAVGQWAMVYSSVATNGLPVLPAADGAINGGSAGAAYTIEGRTAALFVASSATAWVAAFGTVNT